MNKPIRCGDKIPGPFGGMTEVNCSAECHGCGKVVK